jgi:EAL domain-containing protein (putative c-di-GMP-specific phosphodiesterase class I)
MGITLFIDDFGTGYSSLGYLKKLPVDAVKIDKSFVIDMLSDTDSATIVRSTIGLAHDLDLKVVAEGVENQAVLDELALLGCDVAQGYHIGKPAPAEQFDPHVFTGNKLGTKLHRVR